MADLKFRMSPLNDEITVKIPSQVPPGIFPSSSQTSRQTQAPFVAKAFDIKYEHYNDTVTPILDDVEKVAESWDSGIYHAPYTALIGPTMSGKSRLLKAMNNEVALFHSIDNDAIEPQVGIPFGTCEKTRISKE